MRRRLVLCLAAALPLAADEAGGDPWAALAPRQAELVFAAPAATGTAGTFGHVLLRLRGAGGEVAVLYAAEPASYAEDQPWELLWKGLSGGYAASVQVTPWAVELAGFRDQEGRSLWLYPLRLGDAEFSALLREIVARQGEQRPYHLLADNCAAGIVRLLDAAAPQRGLAARVGRWPSPAGVVRAAVASGLIDREGGERIAGPVSRRDDARRLAPPARLGLAFGWADERVCGELQGRLLWAGLDDPASGSPPGDELRALDLALRWSEGGELAVPRATLLSVQAASQEPRRPLGPAWRGELGHRRSGDDDQAQLLLAGGGSWAAHGALSLWALALADGRLIDDAQHGALALGGELGGHAVLGDGALWARLQRRRWWSAPRAWTSSVEGGLAWSWSPPWSLAASASWTSAEGRTLLFALRWHF
ncbi:MAG: DUF4105 domain-containing protein [Planctomycetota bacterium]|nr:DUF4105 domain-containing protein [Planctomycetota bacterium]